MTDKVVKKTEELRQKVNGFFENLPEYQSSHNVKCRELFKELRQAGWQLSRITGGHHHFIHPKAPQVGTATVPLHNNRSNLSVKVVQNVRNQILKASVPNRL
jgi:predicted RNA binding protein YcfA (HicA-like mRNA interferase family)